MGGHDETSDPADPLVEAAAQLGLQPLPGRFVHGFSAAKWLARQNFQIEGTLFSVEVLTLSDPASFSSIREVPLQQLETWTDIPPMALLRRATHLVHAARVRAAQRAGSLADIGLSTGQADQLVRLADFELRFEEARRRYAPSAPSRLSCIFLAEDTPAGRRYAQRVATAHGFVIPVRVPFPLRMARVDANWIGARAEATEAEMRGYWTGEAKPGHAPLWEWLVDGVIRCEDPNALELVRRYSAGAADDITMTAAGALEAGWPHASDSRTASGQ